MTFSPNSVEKIVFAVVRFGFSCECSVVCGRLSMAQNLSCFASDDARGLPTTSTKQYTPIKLYPCLATECSINAFFYFGRECVLSLLNSAESIFLLLH